VTDNANLALWNKVSRVPKEHLKGFTRGGGFKGTAIKPMWSIHTMTEHFGPCGEGWGIGKPDFTVVPSDNETLVYCTVSVWHGKPSNMVYGVGGDKVRATFSSGAKNDDEAFKKAFTDAITNAFKHIGVGADIHMGLWDGNKYVDETPEPEPQPIERKSGDRSPIVRAAYEVLDKTLNQISQTGNLDDLKVFWNDPNNKETILNLPADWKAMLTAKKDEIKEQLTEKAA
jgi:hypothetical protein